MSGKVNGGYWKIDKSEFAFKLLKLRRCVSSLVATAVAPTMSVS